MNLSTDSPNLFKSPVYCFIKFSLWIKKDEKSKGKKPSKNPETS